MRRRVTCEAPQSCWKGRSPLYQALATVCQRANVSAGRKQASPTSISKQKLVSPVNGSNENHIRAAAARKIGREKRFQTRKGNRSCVQAMKWVQAFSRNSFPRRDERSMGRE